MTGSIVRWEADGLHEPPWMRRLHTPTRAGARALEHPEILGDVFAWNKVFRRSFWDAAGLAWPEGVRYEDQPTTTEAYLAGRFDVIPDVVYHWRIRADGSSITQQRSSVRDLGDRLVTKQMALASVTAYDDQGTSRVFLRPGARRRPAPLLLRDPRLLRRLVGPAVLRHQGAVGRALAGATAACRRCTG